MSSAKAISNDNLMEKGLGLSISDEYVTTITFIIIGVSIISAKQSNRKKIGPKKFCKC